MHEGKALAWVVTALGAAAALYFVVHAARAVAFPYPLDYGEGPLLDQARRLAHGEGIYRAHVASYPYTVANYPPIYPALLALLGAAFGFAFPVFRAFTVLAALACAALVFDVVRLRTGDHRAGFVGAAAFLASPYVVFWSTLVRVDFVALAFGLGALRAVVAAPQKKSTVFVAAALCACAALTRQSHLVAAPVAALAALALVRTGRAVAFAIALAALAFGAFVALDAATGGGFTFDIVTANENAYSGSLLGIFFGDLAKTSGVLVVVALAQLRRADRGPLPDGRGTDNGAAVVATIGGRGPGVAAAMYLAGGALSAITIGKVGSHVNYFLELVAGLSIFAGLAAARVGRRRAAWLLAAGAGIACAALFAATRPENMTQKLALRGEFDALRRTVEAEPGLVLADETMALLPLTGRAIVLQPFEFAQLVRAGAWDEAPVVADVRARRFGLVLVNDGPRTPESWPKERWTPALLAAIHDAYEPAGALADATLYRPRRAE
jgi:hypothetical protein